MKFKTIKISETLHEKIKRFCDGKGLKINQTCEMWLQYNIHLIEASDANEPKKSVSIEETE
jgi:hypothetical protein